MSNKQVAVFYGDDASPEVMQPTVDLLRSMNLGIDFIEPLVGPVSYTHLTLPTKLSV
mgnify:CR=1 FL=1